MSSDIAGQCSYCRACIGTGERWIREKVFGTEFAVGGATYDWYHADVFCRTRAKLLGEARTGARKGKNVPRRLDGRSVTASRPAGPS